jgi:hypothetical protein
MSLCACAPEAVASTGTSLWINVTAKRVCAVHRCRTLAGNKYVRVFRATDRHGYDIVFGEWRPTRRLIELEFGRTPITAIRLAGEVFAYAVSNRHEAASTMVYLVRMRRGEEAGWLAADDIEVGSRGITDLALTTSGTVAWMMEGRFQDPADPKNGPHPFSRAVFVVPAHQDGPIFLAYGTGIEPGSLVAAPARMYWFQDGSPRTFAAP